MIVSVGEKYEMLTKEGTKQRLKIVGSECCLEDQESVYCWGFKIGSPHYYDEPRDFIETLVAENYIGGEFIIFLDEHETNLSIHDIGDNANEEYLLLYDDTETPKTLIGRYKTWNALNEAILSHLETKYLIQMLEIEYGIMIRPVFIQPNEGIETLSLKMEENNKMIGYIYSTAVEREAVLGKNYDYKDVMEYYEETINSMIYSQCSFIGYELYEELYVGADEYSLIDIGNGYEGFDIEENGMLNDIGEQWVDAIKI